MNRLLEICIDSVESAIKAEKAGADRLELCENLIQGGITPSIGKINAVISSVSIPVRVLIRPRAGDFFYSPEELDIISEDIKTCAETDCEGIVIGALTDQRELPVDILKIWKSISKNKKLVFHRAFDLARSPMDALNQLVELGFDSVLTSGQHTSAIDGLENLSAWQRDFGSKINILVGGGVRSSNIKQIKSATGITHFHSSAKVLIEGSNQVQMSNSDVSEHIFTVDSNEIKTMKSILNEN